MAELDKIIEKDYGEYVPDEDQLTENLSRMEAMPYILKALQDHDLTTKIREIGIYPFQCKLIQALRNGELQ